MKAGEGEGRGVEVGVCTGLFEGVGGTEELGLPAVGVVVSTEEAVGVMEMKGVGLPVEVGERRGEEEAPLDPLQLPDRVAWADGEGVRAMEGEDRGESEASGVEEALPVPPANPPPLVFVRVGVCVGEVEMEGEAGLDTPPDALLAGVEVADAEGNWRVEDRLGEEEALFASGVMEREGVYVLDTVEEVLWEPAPPTTPPAVPLGVAMREGESWEEGVESAVKVGVGVGEVRVEGVGEAVSPPPPWAPPTTSAGEMEGVWEAVADTVSVGATVLEALTLGEEVPVGVFMVEGVESAVNEGDTVGEEVEKAERVGVMEEEGEAVCVAVPE